MGNSSSNSEFDAKSTSMLRFASPMSYRNLPTQAPLVEEQVSRSESVTSIHDEMSEILNMISRIIVNYIKSGETQDVNEATSSFNEQHFLKKKYV